MDKVKAVDLIIETLLDMRGGEVLVRDITTTLSVLTLLKQVVQAEQRGAKDNE